MTREQFIEIAGGVYESSDYYRAWSGSDKRENFWAFYDGEVIDEQGNVLEPDEEIVSIYAGIEVGELIRKQRYSIEHIIPKSFLKDYLTANNMESRIKRGATTNPFNFAPAHRTLNSNRNSFPFDFEDDKVVRDYRISLEHNYTDYGLDSEMEWVVPSKTRGDIARAILYMSLLYNITEYYGAHLDVLIRWAKQDVPTFWEKKFNEWVQKRLNINNPFISYGVTSSKPYSPLLDDKELLNSIRLQPTASNTSSQGGTSQVIQGLRIVAALVNPLGDDRGNETVSIINTLPETLNLGGLMLRDRMNRRYIIGNTTLEGGEVVRITLDRGNIALANKGGEIQLLSPSEQVIDRVVYERDDLPAKGHTIVFWKQKRMQIVEETQENETVGVKEGQLRILAALVNPLGKDRGNETVSIINTSPDTVNLDGLILRDHKNRDYFIENTTLEGGEVARMTINKDRFILVNTGGEAQLLSCSEAILDSVAYKRKDVPAKGHTLVF